MARCLDMRQLRLITLITGVIFLVFTGGCAKVTRDVPRADYRHGPLPHQARRATDWTHENFLLRSPEDYERIEVIVEDDLSTDQRLTVQEFGNPDFERTYWALTRENVVEWLDIDDNLCFQYVEGEIVFQGSITDLEHTVLRYGVPSRVMHSIAHAGIDRVTFVYLRPFSTNQMHFSFADGQMVFEEVIH